MRLLVTGAEGFLGWHLRARLLADGEHEVVPVARSSWPDLPNLVADADAVLHLAGVNRDTEVMVRDGNVRLAEDVGAAVRASGARPRLVFANSVRSGEPGAYGEGKAAAAAVLGQLADDLELHYADVRLPNLFGEHGRPRYNSFVATFVDSLVAGRVSDVEDRPIRLLHAQAAARSLIDAVHGPSGVVELDGTATSVAEVYRRLAGFHDRYRTGDVPALTSELDVDLFNTLRAALFPTRYPIALTSRSDERGSLVEVVRAAGSPGQTFVSTTRPGATRGEHFHLRKVERFVVIDGRAEISLRRVLTDEVVSFAVDGGHPCIVDMPTLWSHNIVNTGDRDLSTVFWTNELFDPARPDTYPDPVVRARPRALQEVGR